MNIYRCVFSFYGACPFFFFKKKTRQKLWVTLAYILIYIYISLTALKKSMQSSWASVSMTIPAVQRGNAQEKALQRPKGKNAISAAENALHQGYILVASVAQFDWIRFWMSWEPQPLRDWEDQWGLVQEIDEPSRIQRMRSIAQASSLLWEYLDRHYLPGLCLDGIPSFHTLPWEDCADIDLVYW